MTEAAVHENVLTGAILRMRRIGEPEAPFPGWLARVDGAVVQLVDTADLRQWPGWRDRGEHILAVHDVVRTIRVTENAAAGKSELMGTQEGRSLNRESVGHEAALAWCVERVDTFLARRSSAGADLSGGEIVTIVVSLIRGCVAARGAALTGVWWVTQDGTPTFVCGRVVEGQSDSARESIGDAAARVIESLARVRAVTGAWGLPEIASILRAGDDPRAAEAHLFAMASPEPLVLAPLTPRRAAEARRAVATELLEPEHRASFWGRLVARHVDSGVGEMVSDALDGARRATERARRRVARPGLVAAGIAGVIVVAGLAWPASTAPPANARPVASAPPTASAASAATDGASAGVPDPGSVAPPADRSRDPDPAIALSAALDVLGSCGSTPCGAELFEDPSSPDMPAGAVDLAPEQRAVALLDDLGGVAILSVTASDGSVPAQLVVLVRTDQRWLIRGVRDVEGS